MNAPAPAPQPPIVEKPAVKQPDPPPLKQPDPPPVTVTPKVIVLLDSVPQGAEIMRDGQRVDETPANVEIAQGETVTFELHRDGSRDEKVVVDGSKKKMVVKLHHAKAGDEHHHGKMPAPPIVNKPIPKPPVQQPPVQQPPPVNKPPVVTVEHVPETQPPPVEKVPVGAPPPLPSRGGPGRPVVIPPAPLGQVPNKPRKQPVPKKGTDPYERLDKQEEPLDPYK